MNTLKKLLAAGAIVVTGGVIIWNFPAEGTICLEYEEEVCVEEVTQDQACEDILGEFIAMKENFCLETPDKKIKKLNPKHYAVWKMIKDQGCPGENGEYDISKLKVGTEYVYCDDAKKLSRKKVLRDKLESKEINWVEKRELVGILEIDATPLEFQGTHTIDEAILDATSDL